MKDPATAWRVRLCRLTTHDSQKPIKATTPFSPDLLYKGRDSPRHHYEAVYNNSKVALHPFDPTQLFVCGTRVAVRVPEIFRRLPKTMTKRGRRQQSVPVGRGPATSFSQAKEKDALWVVA